MAEKLTVESVRSAIWKLLGEYGWDFVYNIRGECDYVPNELNDAGCGVGEVVKLHGFDPNELDPGNIGGINREQHFTYLRIDEATDSHVVFYLREFQELQDSGIAWGECYEQTELSYSNFLTRLSSERQLARRW